MIPFLKDVRNDNAALYLNFPFCVSPCSYCHYIKNVKFGHTNIPSEYFEAICNQLIEVCNFLPQFHYKSIYLGGGTPSLLNDNQIETISKIIKEYDITSDEISMELHPHYNNFDFATNNFITRYSIAVQAFDDILLSDYRRSGYNYDSIEQILRTLRLNLACSNINIDLIFDECIPPHTVEYIEKLQPDTVTIYPNTKGRGIERLVSVRKELLAIKKHFTNYKTVAKSNFIFVNNNSVHSQYSKIECETFGDIIGLGHNSVSLIGDTSYLTLYENGYEKIEKRENKGSRYLSAFLGSLPVGVTYESVCKYMPKLKNGNYLFTVDNDADINEKHTLINESELVYLPESEYIRFITNILPNYSKYKRCFLSSIGYGDENETTLTYVYNSSLILDNDETNELVEALGFTKEPTPILNKLCLPNKKILVEGIDGSGKDTFVQILNKELKKRFFYNSDCTISVLGQPDSHLQFGSEAKEFIEDLVYTDKNQIITALKGNRQKSEEKIMSFKGIQILIRGIVTDLATLKIVFGDVPESYVESENPCQWDYYIVVKTDPIIANDRIQSRGIPRTWRETPEFLQKFSDYYLSFDSKRFSKKIIIENTSISNLKKMHESWRTKYMQNNINEIQNKAITIFLKLQGTKCNMRCIYCYSHDKSEKNRNIQCSPQSVTNYLSKYVDYDHVFIVFHGGEPLLYPIKDISYILEFIVSHFYKNIHIQFQTNGTLISENWLKLFAMYSDILSISVSIDPNGEQDLRVYPTNITKEDVYNNIIKCSNIINNVGIISVAHKYNYNSFNKFIIELKNMGIHNLTINKYQPNSNWENDEYYITEMQYTDLLIDTFKFWISQKLYKDIRIQPIQSLFSKNGCKICRYMYDDHKCTYFHTFFDEQNKASFCDHITNNTLPKLPSTCQKCSILEKCGGGCLTEEKDLSFCDARQKLFDFIGGYLL